MGLATIAEVWVNGRHVLHSDDMYLAHEISIIAEPTNDVVVVCRSLRDHLAIRRPRGR